MTAFGQSAGRPAQPHALAGGKDHHYGRGWYVGRSFDAAVIDGNPVFHDGFHEGHFEHGKRK
ncbi:hypothetical protein ACFVT2_27665 [Streptomyces sp. NPDC058000]|uniref:hypothetical protein n=1 Tax=Streptomyces sp. NPDC058000 TaxID=3346299 RepID=UPI0036DFD9D5